MPEQEKKVTTLCYEHITRYMKMCKSISMWPIQDTNPFLYWTVFSIVLSSTTFVVVLMWMHILNQSTKIDGIAQVIDFATVYSSAVFRYLHVLAHGREYLQLVDYLRDNFISESFNRRGEKLSVRKFIRRSTFFTMSFSALLQFWLIQMTITPIAHQQIRKNMRDENGTLIHPEVELKMPIDVPMPFDMTHPIAICFGYFIIVFSCYMTSLVYSFLDCFWFACIILATGQFEMITHSLRSYTEEYGDSTVRELEPGEIEEVRSVLDSCLTQHGRIRQFIHLLENMMNLCLLIDFLHATASISFILLDLSLAFYQASIKILITFGYLMISVCHMWILDYLGNELSVKEEELASAVYEIPWYKYPLKVRSHALLMMKIARKPYKLTGGKLFKISLEFFAGALRTIFSYFTVLLQLMDPNN